MDRCRHLHYQYSRMNGAYLHFGAVGHREHAERDGRELSGRGTPADVATSAIQGRSAELLDGGGAQANRAAALDVEARPRDDADAQPGAAELETPRRGGGLVRDAIAEYDPVDDLGGRRCDVALAHVGRDARGVSLERIAKPPAAARLHQQHVAELERKSAHLARQGRRLNALAAAPHPEAI